MANTHRRLAPEVIQSSALDCGPAALKCILDGHGIPVPYGRLREACQTDVDGTSIDALESVARDLGLDVEQVVVPPEHVALPHSRPALAVTALPGGATHLTVVWGRAGGLVQLMDPAVGRRWVRPQRLREQLYEYSFEAPAREWREWAGSDESVAAARRRLAALGVGGGRADSLIAAAAADAGWRGLAALDAALRTAERLARARGLRRGAEAERLIGALAGHAAPEPQDIIPSDSWSVTLAEPGAAGEELLTVRGAILVRVRGRRAPGAAVAGLTPELAAALAEPQLSVRREVLGMLRADGLLTPAALLLALAIGAGGVIAEALVYQTLLWAAAALATPEQRLGAFAAGALLFLALLLAEHFSAGALLRMGRSLEVRLRARFLAKLPRLGDRYFRSRLISDMAERSHSLHLVRGLPLLGGRLLEQTFAVAGTAAGLIWLSPAAAPLVLLTAAAAIGLPLAAQPLLAERERRVRAHVGAIGTFYLDALLGLLPIRSHRAEGAVRREHAALTARWAEASYALRRAGIAVEIALSVVGLGCAAALTLTYLGAGGALAAAPLVAYWALSLPAMGEELATLLRRYPLYHTLLQRLLEPIAAPDDEPPPAPSAPRPTGPATVSARGVTVRAGGHTILEEIDLDVAPGEHIAVVGPSGAGKSSLLGLLLGWHRPAEGQLLVDGRPLGGDDLDALRVATAWVDPAVQIWNRDLAANLRYGSVGPVSRADLDACVEAAGLRPVLERLPNGLATPLGEGGGLVSGGEGQRVRLGRAMLREGARLALLDEPFRGLDRDQRAALLLVARSRWAGATLICVTHDIAETRAFGRVLVLQSGRIVEDGDPAALAADPQSRYRAMLDEEAELRAALWGGPRWRRLRLHAGRLHTVEHAPAEAADAD